ncbi:SDR family NAD(P)-dependent oxidoreductase [Kordiimonas aquimaris]|uniref:SDR family NAD(P)-dependent oxidoreductase n=1 Tax=Kordiimonas aquimaris TaxID=707591 RepID=UPI0021D18222|nr:SDR family NAD(P)-dependent oxidoreductase [Kordiimonas aquimaris]
MNNIAVIGASGAIGGALIRQLAFNHPESEIRAFSRSPTQFDLPNVHSSHIDLLDEMSIEMAAGSVENALSLIIIASGILHDDQVSPEKSMRELSVQKFEQLFAVNTIGPSLAIKHFAPKLDRKEPSALAVLSARVGSISDNQLGGWYAYRASKAALNMVIKTASIELARRNKSAAIVGLHPGTVDSKLSEPFQSNVPDGKLFSPDHSADMMLKVLVDLKAADTGFVFDFNGKRIPF